MAVGIRERVKEGEGPKPTRYFSGRQEDQVAKKIGGRKTANSGATMFGGKSDVHTKKLAVECKTKTKSVDSFSIKKEWLLKNQQEAVSDGKPYNVLAFNFGPGEPNYYIIDEDMFIDFLEYINTKDEL